MAAILGATYLSSLASGYRLDDLLVYLPMTLYLRDGSLYPDSPLIKHLLSMPYPVYRAYAAVFDQHVLFGVFLVARLALVWALYRLGTALARDRASVWFGLGLLLLTPGTFGTLGSTQLLLTEPSQYALAEPLCFFALALALTGHRALAFVLAGAAFDLQPMLGTVALSLLGTDLVINKSRRDSKVSVVQTAAYLGLGLVTALPGLASAVRGVGSGLLYSSAEYISILRFAAPFHIFPSAFTPFEYASTAITLVSLSLGLRLMTEHRATLATWLAVIGVFCVVGTLFSEWLPVGFILKLMPFRSTLFFKAVGSFLAATYLSYVWRAGTLLDRGIAAAIIVATACALLTLQTPSAPLWLSSRYQLVLLVIVVTAGLAWLIGRSHVGVSAWELQRVLSGHAHVTRLLLVALASGMFVGLGVAALPRGRFLIPSDKPANDLEEAAAWAKATTPLGALFLTPPDSGVAEFTLFAERGTLGDAKLAGQALFDPSFGMLLFTRLADLGCNGRWCTGDNTYSYFDGHAFHTLGDRYGACFALTRASQQVVLPEVFRNTSFRIYALCGPDSQPEHL